MHLEGKAVGELFTLGKGFGDLGVELLLHVHEFAVGQEVGSGNKFRMLMHGEVEDVMARRHRREPIVFDDGVSVNKLTSCT